MVLIFLCRYYTCAAVARNYIKTNKKRKKHLYVNYMYPAASPAKNVGTTATREVGWIFMYTILHDLAAAFTNAA